MDHLCSLITDSKLGATKLTKIVCTIGPASRDVQTLEQLIDAGMNVARLNLSHGTHDYHRETIKNIRLASTNYKNNKGVEPHIAIALDTRGREIRTGLLEGGHSAEVELVKGELIKLTSDKTYEHRGTKSVIYVGYRNITNVVNPGNRIFVDDGLISLICQQVQDTCLICRIENGGLLGSRKGINLPGVKVDLPAVSETDKLDLQFGIDENVDMIFGSFTPNAAAVFEMRDLLKKNPTIKIISKIENQLGIDNADEIIDASDGIMVERGDLGSEIPIQKVFLVQKSLIARSNRAGKPVICATQMLESMTNKPIPTRAEITDVANAVFDGADCVMLSGETAKGEYPVECVAMMASICLEAEAARWHDFRNDLTLSAVDVIDVSIKNNATAIVIPAFVCPWIDLIPKFQLRCPIIVVTESAFEARHMQIYRAIIPVYYDASTPSVDDRIKFGISFAKNQGIVNKGDNVIVVTRWTSKPNKDLHIINVT